MKIDLSVELAGIKLNNPIIACSGTAGYGPELTQILDTNQLGAITTKTITLNPRPGNPPPRIVETPAGLINSIGLANIGLDRFIEEKLPLIHKLNVPVFVNIAGSTIEEYCRVAEKIDNCNGISAIEVNISCPNVSAGGIEFGVKPDLAYNLIKSIKDTIHNHKLIVKLTPNVTDISEIAIASIEAGADVISLINTVKAMSIDIKTRKPIIARGFGGLSGPAIKPIALYNVWKVYNEVCKNKNIPIIGIGGILTGEDAIEMLLAGASAIGIGTGIFIDHQIVKNILSKLMDYCTQEGYDNLRDITGALQNPKG